MSNHFSIFLLAAIIAHGPVHPVDGREFFLRTSEDVNDAINQVRPGDTIVLADGTWRDADVLFHATGTAEAPITLRAQTPGKVVLTGHSRLRLAGQHLIVSGLLFRDAWHESALIEFRKDSKQAANDCRVTDCAIIERTPPHPQRSMKHISLYGRRNRVDHCHLEGKQTEGATLVVWLADGPAEHRIDHVFFGPRLRLGKNGGETIRVGDSTTSLIDAKVLVERNYFQECNGEVEIISNKSCGNTYRNNTFLRCEGALTLRHGNRCLVEGNYFLGQGARYTGGVRIVGEDHRIINNYFGDLRGKEPRAAVSMMNGIPNTPLHGYRQVTRATVAFNTFANCKWSLAIGLGDRKAILPPRNCLIANNLFLPAGSHFLDEQNRPESFQWQGNLIQMQASVPDEIGKQVDDLRMRQAKDGIWRPLPDSAAVGTAQGEFPQIATDIDAQSRPNAKDVGCDQVMPSKARTGPLAAHDVGISWKIHP